MARKNVSASEVRAWLNSDAGTEAIAAAHKADETVPTKVGERGRPNPAHVALFRKANKGKTYEVGSEAEKPTVTVPVTGLDSLGRKTTRKVTLTTEEARKVLGQEGKTGRISHSLLSEALSAQAAAEVAAQFTTAA